MIRIKKFCKNHIYAFTFFAFLVLYNFIVVSECKLPVISSVVYSFHAVDYSMGFCSKLLPGAIFNLFYDEMNHNLVLLHESVLLLLLFLIVAVFCEKLLKKTTFEYRKTALIVIFFFLSGPGTFAPFVIDIGSLDVYWVFSSVFFLICLSNKRLYPLIIIPFIACVLVHFASFICYIPFFIVLTIYKISCLENKKEKKLLWICLTISALIALAFAIYFVMFEKSNVTYTIEEFHSILESKGVTHFRYYDWALYQTGESVLEGQIIEFEESQGLLYAILTVFQQIQISIKFLLLYPENLSNVFFVILLTFPILFLLFSFIVIYIKDNKRNRLKTISLFCSFLLFFATFFAGLLFSADHVRWLVHAFLILATTCFYISYAEKQTLWSVINSVIQKVPVLFVVLYYIIYAMNTFDLYS